MEAHNKHYNGTTEVILYVEVSLTQSKSAQGEVERVPDKSYGAQEEEERVTDDSYAEPAEFPGYTINRPS